VPTYRHRVFAGYQSGRQFDPELLDQLDVLPDFVAACGFVFAKSPGCEADDFLAAAVAYERDTAGKLSYRVESASTINGLNMRSAFIAGRNSPIDREPRGSSFHTACGVPGGMIIPWPRCNR